MKFNYGSTQLQKYSEPRIRFGSSFCFSPLSVFPLIIGRPLIKNGEEGSAMIGEYRSGPPDDENAQEIDRGYRTVASRF